MSPTCRPDTVMLDNFSRKVMSQRHKTWKKRPRHTQFIPITADKFKSAQTYEYPSYHRVFVFELKQQSRNCRHLTSNVVSFWPHGRHNIFLCRRHDQRHVADMSPTRHAMSANEGSGRHDKWRHSLLSHGASAGDENIIKFESSWTLEKRTNPSRYLYVCGNMYFPRSS
jgi:hypothetical protein